MSDWPTVAVSEVCELIVDCVNRTAPLADEETPFKMIRTTNVRDGFIDTDSVRYVTEPTFARWTRRAVPRPGDVVLTREAPLGEVGIIRRPENVFLGQRTIMYRAYTGRYDPYFLMYSMLGDEVQGQIRGFGSGSTVEHMRLPDCYALKVPFPPLGTQRKIAAILSAYDDLIQNNNGRIKLLEEMAQRIYREWFVDFRYPGHENMPLADSTLGSIPAGWDWGAASEVLSINPEVDIDGSVAHPFVPMTSVSESGMHLSPLTERVGASGARFINGDTLFARITPCLENGKTAFVQCLPEKTAATGSTEFIVLRSKKLCPEMVYLLARREDFRSHAIKSMSGATGRQRVREECFASFMVRTPPQELISAFRGAVHPLFTLSNTLHLATQLLRSARDLLLPRLISGAIDVEGLNIRVREGTA